jgi:hypothetical protein
VNWSAIEGALFQGHRGLPGGSSLSRLLAQERNTHLAKDRYSFTISEVLSLADAYHERYGKWPKDHSGRIPQPFAKFWQRIGGALKRGRYGLPGGTTLARLLNQERGARYARNLKPLTAADILGWADAHHARTGKWPTCRCGAIPEAPGEKWMMVNAALYLGHRGIPGGSTLGRFLARSGRTSRRDPPLGISTESQPVGTGPSALPDYHPRMRREDRRLGRGHSTRVLTPEGMAARQQCGEPPEPVDAKSKGRRKKTWGRPPLLTVLQILAWADAHHQRTGRWPSRDSGPIPGTREETWVKVCSSLSVGRRGLPGGSSLAKLLVEQRGKKSIRNPAPLSIPLILAWADAFRARTGRWPTRQSGPVADTPGESWCTIDDALSRGCRGLPGGLSVSRLLARERNVYRATDLDPLTPSEILRQADV